MFNCLFLQRTNISLSAGIMELMQTLGRLLIRHQYLLIWCLPLVGGQIFPKGLRYSLNADGLSYTCTGIGNYFGNKIKFPSLYNGLPITAIAENAFVQNGFINVVISSSITTIGERAFLSCHNLEKVTFDEGSKLQVIEGDAFNGCGALSEITIPSSVVTISGGAFAGCDDLQTVRFAEGSKLQTIGDYAFENCTSLTEITIPSEVTTIERNAFGGCINLQTVIFAEGSKLQTIGYYAFGNCTSLTEITIPSEVTTIEGNAFGGCINLQTVIFAEGSKLQTIGDNAFGDCASLKGIIIPSSIRISIGVLLRGVMIYRQLDLQKVANYRRSEIMLLRTALR